MTARLDTAVAARGLARSRSHAAALIAAGAVSIDGAVVTKAATQVGEAAQIAVSGADGYVSRAAHKLIAALDGFGIDPAARVALDMGASTGGFTQVLLERGARRVLAVDVGHDQLAPELRSDERVSAVEGFNVRYMTPAALAEASGSDDPPTLITGDLSFISLRHVLPAVAELAAQTPTEPRDIVLLVKPQFEVGRQGIRAGIVVSDELRAAAVADVIDDAGRLGLAVYGVLPSPVAGTHGNREALLHLGPAAAAGEERAAAAWTEQIARATAA